MKRSPLALAVLCLLTYEPMHPYRMQLLIKQWGKDEVINVGQRATLYKTIDRLRDHGLIEVLETERASQFPERTVYSVTGQGRQAWEGWLSDMIATPKKEFPEFPAGVSFLLMLEPARALGLLDHRRERLTAEVERLRAALATQEELPRVSRLEGEYTLAMTTAELQWVLSVADDLREGRLHWEEDQLRDTAARALGP